MTDLVALKAANENRWADAKVTRNFAATAAHLVAAKNRYQAVEAKTGVPWFVIAVIHMRESSQNWAGSIAQGDPWNFRCTSGRARAIRILGRGCDRRLGQLRAVSGAKQELVDRAAP